MFTVGDGGGGPYKSVLVGDPSLPTHAIYRPRDLSKFGGTKLMPVVAWANGGCRNTSGEFRNFLTQVASHGFFVVAIGPAAYAIALGSEQPTDGTTTALLFDGLTWAAGENPATYREPRGGAFATVAVAWLKWRLQNDTSAARTFVGDTCGLCRDSKWTVERKDLQ